MPPKIHKEGNPGRPIISGRGTLTEPMSSYIDSLIKKIPTTHPSYLSDTNHFLREIDNIKIPDGAFLATPDATSLYTNIPHRDGIKALVEFYSMHRDDDSSSPQVTETLTKLVQELNRFEFHDQYYF